jgi:sialate O-acetylesterase
MMFFIRKAIIGETTDAGNKPRISAIDPCILCYKDSLTMRMTIKAAGLAFLLLASAEAPAAPQGRDLRLPKIFGDHMVVQRGVPIPVWGWAAPGEKIVVNLGGAVAAGTADKDGRWMAKVPPIKQPGGPFDMVVGGRSAVTFKDVLVGDVWVCGGQSNMEWGVGGCNAPGDIQGAKFPLIRCIKVQKKPAAAPEKDITGSWQVCSPATVAGFTAVGYFFARTVHEETRVPIGLIDSNWGGTAIEPWIVPDGLKLVNELSSSRAEADKQAAEWAEGKPHTWSVLYNGMIAPVVPYGVKGALWYQGESNGGEGDSYFHKMRALIGGWRQVWGLGDFPFYFVQLANFQQASENPAGGDGWAKIRMAQAKSLQIPNTGMAVTTDIGEAGDIHPKNKQDVGRRLALWALAKDYGKKTLVYSGPLYKDMRVEDNRIRVLFDCTGSGLMVGKKEGLAPTVEAKGERLQRFAIAGANKQWSWANAQIDGKTVVVWSEKVPRPVAIRYAFSMNPQGANLYNKEGLPASPFRTDDW